MKTKLRKENLKDSLKLNREWLSKRNELGESKFAEADDEDDDEDEDDFLDENRNEENHHRQKEVVLQLGKNRKKRRDHHMKPQRKEELMDYLDSVRVDAEKQREELSNGPGSLTSFSSRNRKYDWEAGEESEDDDSSHFGGAPPSIASSSRMPPPPMVIGGGDESLPPSPPSLPSASRYSARSSVHSHGSGSKMMSMKLEIEEKTKTIDSLKRALQKTRRDVQSINEKNSQETSEALEQQRKEHEKAVARHLGFIDKLLADKKQLAGKMEEMAHRMKKSEDAMAKKVHDLEEKHKLDMVRLKETLAASDTAKRQKWQREKTRELKELTIKGLEPEVQSILAKHKDDLAIVEDKFREEIKVVKAQHDKELARAKQDLLARHEIDLQEMRTKERSAMQAKLREMEARHQKELNSQRERYETELVDMRERHKEELKDSHIQFKERVTEAIKTKEHDLLEQKRRLETQLESMEQRWALEKEQWQAKLVRKMEEKAQSEERKLREQLTASRDKQIDAVISKLHEEQEARMEQVRNQYEKQIQDMEAHKTETMENMQHKIDDWQEKYERLRASHRAEKKTFSSAESRVRELEQLAEKREARIVELSKRVSSINDLLSEREEQVRAEYAEKNAHTIHKQAKMQEDINALKEKLSSESIKQKQRIKELEQNYEEETEEIHRRVRLTIARKDETIRTLREQLDDLQHKFDTYAELMEKQRREFIGEN